jgi:cysteine desulfurase
MQPWLADRFGNPSSRDHVWGWDAADAVEDARSAVANQINAYSNEIIFTSGATEGLNIAVKGFVGFHDWQRKRIVTCATEHDAVLAPCLQLAKATGIEVHVLPVDQRGNVDLEQLEAAVYADKQVLVAIMAANNEIGTIHPIRKIAEVAHGAGALFLCDMTQAMGKVPVDVHADDIDMCAFSAHKMYGPKGVGALFVRNRETPIELEPLILGGQERGLRGGTLNVPGIVGFGEACRIALQEMDNEIPRIAALRDTLEDAILSEILDTWVNGDRGNRICNTTNIGFHGVDARTLIRDMHDIAVSTQAACSSGSGKPSHVLKAIGLSDDEASSSIRFSLGRFTTAEEIDYTINKAIDSVHKLRRSKGVAP